MMMIVCLGLAGATNSYGQKPVSSVSLYEEAQRYHLGLDRPVDYARAMSIYERLTQSDPSNKDAWYNMAHISFTQKRYDLAETYYKHVIRIDPQDSDACNNLATVYMRQGDVAKAKRMYAKAVQLNPGLAMAFYNLTFIFYKEGDQTRAEKAILEALKLEPENPEFLRLYAQIMGESGKISDWWAVAAFGGFGGVIVVYHYLFGRKGVRS